MLKINSIFVVLLLAGSGISFGSSDDDARLLRAAGMDAGKMSDSEKNLYQQSIRDQKRSISEDVLEIFYHDARDAYADKRYAEAQELLDKIYSVNPNYEDVASFRERVTAIRKGQDAVSKRSILEDFMRKGNNAYNAGQRTLAISFWKQALAVDPAYKPAKERVLATNQELAKDQFEEGYKHYHNSEFDEALDNWANAIALNPAYKNQGLLLLMSKVKLTLNKQQSGSLSTQAADQYEKGQLEDALASYQQLVDLQSRNEEARRMVAKIRYQLGHSAFEEAQTAANDGRIVVAMKSWERSKTFGYEVVRSQKGIEQMEALMKKEREPKPRVRVATKPVEPTPTPAAAPQPPAEPVKPVVSPQNAEEALTHYRNGLNAFRRREFTQAVTELRIANQLNPVDERIYMALQRAEGESSNPNGGGR